jgi:nucleoside-diphosphate-sugar epimerase
VRVLLTGATGVVGRATARQLIAAGHSVSAFGAGEARAARLRTRSVTPLDVDLFDANKLPAIMRDVDAVLHLATRIPPFAKMRSRRAWAENDRLRTIATGLLVDAALTAATKIFLVHGISFLYADQGASWIDERTPFAPSPGQMSMLDAEAHVQRFSAAGRTGIVLRNGLFYGPECQSVADALELAKRRVAMAVGKKGAYFSSLHIDDAATATACALSAPAGVYNVCDDEPVPRGEYVECFARAFGLPRLRMLPSWLVSLGGGSDARLMMRSQRVSNRRFKDTTGWQPAFPSVRQGWPAIAAQITSRRGRAS